MDTLTGKTYLGIGGVGLVGLAITRKIMELRPDSLYLTSLREHEIVAGIEKLKHLGYEIKDAGKLTWIYGETQIHGKELDILPKDVDLNDSHSGEAHHLVKKIKPDVITNTVTTATALSYGGNEKATPITKLTWFMQSLYHAMIAAETKVYLKVGTMGTGGLGWNIPYSHGEGGNRPSNQLCGKNQLAFGETGILTLWSKNPQHFGPEVIELKIGAAIGYNTIDDGVISWLHVPRLPEEIMPSWTSKEISYYEPVTLSIGEENNKKINWHKRFLGKVAGLFIKTGENGQFSLNEFLALTRHDQMGIITAEEIARYALMEISGKATGYNFLITGRVMPPSQLGGELRHIARRILLRKKEEKIKAGITRYMTPFYLNLGPPRLSKLIGESYLIKKSGIETLEKLASIDVTELSDRLGRFVEDEKNKEVISEMTSLGIPLLKNDKEILVGPLIAVPGLTVTGSLMLEKTTTTEHACLGWMDLRPEKFGLMLTSPTKSEIFTGLAAWKERAEKILSKSKSLKTKNFHTLGSGISDNLVWTDYLTAGGEIKISPGELAGWVLANEDKGVRAIS